MMSRGPKLRLSRSLLLSATILGSVLPIVAHADIDDRWYDGADQIPLPTGQFITPNAAPGSVFLSLNPGIATHPNFVAGGGIKTAVSPDGRTLLVMTSGYNELANAAQTATDSTSQFIFVYDISERRERNPVQKQVIKVPDTYAGLVWAPDGSKFYVSGGSGDTVYVYGGSPAAGWAQSGAIAMGHKPFGSGTPYSPFLGNGVGFLETATVSGLGLSRDGSVLVAANIYNDSITVIDTKLNTVRYEYDLRPFNTSSTAGTGVAGGEVPFDVAVKGNTVAYVSSIRDREVVVVNLGATGAGLITRIALPGNPNSMVLSADQSRLYVAQDNSDSVAVIDTYRNVVLDEISTIAPPGLLRTGVKYTGAAANGLALSPDGRTLYVTNGAANSVAIIPLRGFGADAVAGLVPTGWYPNSVSLSRDGRMMYVVNAKSVPGPNPNYTTTNANSDYVEQLEGSGLLAMPVPDWWDLESLTAQVAANNHYSLRQHEEDVEVMEFLHRKINHVIYIIKENRTFDQVLGDLHNGSNGDPSLTTFGAAITPNFHRLAQNFVTLDNFYCSGEVSGNGWAWSTEARESDHGTKSIPPNYAGRGASNDSEGTNRDINVGIGSFAARNAALNGVYGAVANQLPGGALNVLPGTNNDFATDGPNGLKQAGYIWDAALRAGLSVRDYGFFIDLTRYSLPITLGGLQPVDYAKTANYLRAPASIGVTVATSTSPTLAPYTDPYFRGFDNAFPDVWRVEEWRREFANYVTGKNLPNLTLLRLMHDHMGNFSGSDQAVAGLTTPETQQADNDLAVGQVIDTVAHSPYAGSTLIFVIEDDAQDGPDHVDAHRSTAYIVGPYVKHNSIVSKRYSTVNLVRTIEDILGLDHLNLNDAYQKPMTEVFDPYQSTWTYSAIASTYLKNTTIAAAGETIQYAAGPTGLSTHDAEYWGEVTRGFDFTAADRVPADIYNEVLWEGLKPGVPYPTHRSGADLRRRPAADTAVSARD